MIVQQPDEATEMDTIEQKNVTCTQTEQQYEWQSVLH
jgi:hypothetical protein